MTAIAGMVREAREQGALAIAAVGTAGLRIASNRREVLDAIRARTGVEVEVISGEEEGRLAYLAVQSGLDLGSGSLVVFDTGGGSSQFTFGHGSHVDERFSVDVGAVRATERFGLAGAVTPDVLSQALAAISTDLVRISGRPKPDRLVGMGGAVTNLAAVKHGLAKYDPDRIQGSVLDRAEIDRQIELYRSERRRCPPFDRRVAAQAGRDHPRRGLHRAHDPGEARPGRVHRQRSRPPARTARRKVRRDGHDLIA